MALTGPRLAGLVALAAAAIALALLPPSPEYWSRRGYAVGFGSGQARVDQLQRAVSWMERRVRAAEVRDLIRASLRKDPIRPGDPPQLWTDAALSSHLATVLRASWDSLIRALEPSHPATGLAVLLMASRAGTPARHWHYLPDATDGRTCVAVVEIDAWRRPWPDRRQWLRRVLGPCAFYAAFGPPGVRVREWMDAGAYRVTYAPTWDVSGSNRRPVAANPFPVAGSGIQRRLARLIAPPPRLSLERDACAVGRLDACRLYLATDGLRSSWVWRSPDLPGVIANRAALWAWYDPDVLYFLSDLVRLRGKVQFAAWWQSAGAVDTAFAATYGVSLDRWTMRWVRQRSFEPTGPHVRWSSAVTSLLVAATLVAAAVWYAVRRQVT